MRDKLKKQSGKQCFSHICKNIYLDINLDKKAKVYLKTLREGRRHQKIERSSMFMDQ